MVRMFFIFQLLPLIHRYLVKPYNLLKYHRHFHILPHCSNEHDYYLGNDLVIASIQIP